MFDPCLNLRIPVRKIGYPQSSTARNSHVPYENDHNLLGGIQSIFRHLKYLFSRTTGLRTVGQVDCLPSGSFCCRLGLLLTPTTWECSWGVVSMGRTMVTTSTSWDRYILYIDYVLQLCIYIIYIYISPLLL